MNVFRKITIETLKKNRTRTIVTLIGVILSAAMLTAVTSLISSLQNNMLQSSIQSYGDWHIRIDDMQEADILALPERDDVQSALLFSPLGHALLGTDLWGARPYAMGVAVEKGAFEALPIDMIAGRLPQNSGEILITTGMQNAGMGFGLSEKVTFALGTRMLEEEALPLLSSAIYVPQENGGEPQALAETLTNVQSRTYTIVGVCKTYLYNGHSEAGYPFFTVAETPPTSAYIKLKKPGRVYAFAKEYEAYSSTSNSQVLRYMGISNIGTFNTTLYSLAAVLIFIIMGGSIMLIYNAFSISIGERTQQFGLLSSIGATRRQLHKSVTFEAFVVAVIGIPIGVGCGLLGIYVTLTLLGDATRIMSMDDIPFTLHVAPLPLLIAALISAFTIYLSAFLPARRAARMSAMDAIRQAQDIRVRTVRTSKLAFRLFKLEGALADVSFRRNRRRYRSTVVALFLSIVLFVSASAFIKYLTMSVTDVYQVMDFDMLYILDLDRQEKSDMQAEAVKSLEEVYWQIAQTDGVEHALFFTQTYVGAELPAAYFHDAYLTGEEQSVLQAMQLTFLEDASYQRFVEENGIAVQEGEAVLLDTYVRLDRQEQKYYAGRMLKRLPPQIEFALYDAQGEQTGTATVVAGATSGASIPGYHKANESLELIYPMRAYAALFPDGAMRQSRAVVTIKSGGEESVKQAVTGLLAKKGLGTNPFFDVTSSQSAEQKMLLIIKVFSMGFIVLISLIAVANIFNTMSTNIQLRRREFAMLRSVGMEEKSFRRMLNYECLLYGCKALLYGLPAAFVMTYLIHMSVSSTYLNRFVVPWGSVLISVGSVFLVVFLSMLYAASKVRKQNIIDALKMT